MSERAAGVSRGGCCAGTQAESKALVVIAIVGGGEKVLSLDPQPRTEKREQTPSQKSQRRNSLEHAFSRKSRLAPGAQVLFCLVPQSALESLPGEKRLEAEPARPACGLQWGREASGRRYRCPWGSLRPCPCAFPGGPGAHRSSTWGGRWRPCHPRRVR